MRGDNLLIFYYLSASDKRGSCQKDEPYERWTTWSYAFKTSSLDGDITNSSASHLLCYFKIISIPDQTRNVIVCIRQKMLKKKPAPLTFLKIKYNKIGTCS